MIKFETFFRWEIGRERSTRFFYPNCGRRFGMQQTKNCPRRPKRQIIYFF